MTETSRGQNFPELVALMQRLLAEDGCPWDREQTFETLRPFVIEEAFEVVDAIDSGDRKSLKEELGDLLFQVVFQAELGRAENAFVIDEVIESIVSKMTRRHPHVFGDEKAANAQEVLEQWEKRKERERAGKPKKESILGGVPKAMPALLRAVRIGEKAAGVGFDWENASGARAKIAEELAELDEACERGNRAEMEAELGDLLFALTSWARKAQLDPEAALRGSLDRFSNRFSSMEKAANADGSLLSDMSAGELDALWEKAKSAEASEAT